MKHIQILLIIFIVCSSFAEKGKWIVSSQSTITIHGSTNINKFKCEMNCYNASDTLEYTSNVSIGEYVFGQNQMTIPVQDFDCGNPQITRDFRQTLNVKRHPNLVLHFVSIQHIKPNSRIVQGVINITLSGETKQYKIKYDVEKSASSEIHLRGKQLVQFSDFDLTAPQKMLGLIQVDDCLDVEFDLVLKRG